jgi:hypothetical protein
MPVIENAQCLCPECLRAEIAARSETQFEEKLEPRPGNL